MRAIWLAIALLLSAPASADSLFVSVNVVSMDRETVLRDQDVLVRGTRIEAIAPTGTLAKTDAARRIDAAGLYLMPGLVEMHAHVPPGTQVDYQQRVLTLFVAAGVTTVRGMLGEPSHLELRRRIDAGQTLGPRLVTSGPSFNARSVDGAQDVQNRVREQKAAGYDFLKVHPGLSAAEFDALSRAAALESIPFAGHVTQAVGLHQVLAQGQATIDHLDGYMESVVSDGTDLSALNHSFFGVGLAAHVDPQKIPLVARETAERGVWNVPTLSLVDNLTRPEPTASLAARPEMRFMPQGEVRRWSAARDKFIRELGPEAATMARASALRLELIAALFDAGAGLLLGSDAPQVFNVPGFALHRELELMHEAGLSRFEALQTGTVAPAFFFGERDRTGKVTEGFVADLLLLNDNPLQSFEVLREPAGVMLRGNWLPRAELDRLLARYASP